MSKVGHKLHLVCNRNLVPESASNAASNNDKQKIPVPTSFLLHQRNHLFNNLLLNSNTELIAQKESSSHIGSTDSTTDTTSSVMNGCLYQAVEKVPPEGHLIPGYLEIHSQLTDRTRGYKLATPVVLSKFCPYCCVFQLWLCFML